MTTLDPLPDNAPAVEVDIAHALAPVQARDLAGRPVRLGTLWEDRPAVLIFLRHFG
jgi:hypothetical protein